MHKFLKIPACLVLSFGFISTALAQQATTTPPAPPPLFCENNEGFSDFDFWVGDWNVYSNDGKRVFQGTNSIEKKYGNCLITETWVGASGSGGFSINYYNSVLNEWRQVWVANGYSIDYTGGLDDDGAMVLVGFIYGYGTGATTPFRGTWSQYENGDVRQFFEIHNAEGEWTTWFDGLYVKQEADPNPPEGNS